MNNTDQDHALHYARAAGDALGRLKGFMLWIEDEDVPRKACVEKLKKLIADHETNYPDPKTEVIN